MYKCGGARARVKDDHLSYCMRAASADDTKMMCACGVSVTNFVRTSSRLFFFIIKILFYMFFNIFKYMRCATNIRTSRALLNNPSNVISAFCLRCCAYPIFIFIARVFIVYFTTIYYMETPARRVYPTLNYFTFTKTKEKKSEKKNKLNLVPTARESNTNDKISKIIIIVVVFVIVRDGNAKMNC